MAEKRVVKAGIGVLISLAVLTGAYLAGCNRQQAPSEYVGFPKSFAELAERVRPAVVNISTITTVTVPGSPFRHFFGHGDGSDLDQFFNDFFGEVPDRKMKQQSLGSGFIIDKDGEILTNNHVVDNADEIKVKLSDGREFKARVLGRDLKTDLALIKISSTFANLPVLALGDSDKIRVGDWVMAVGNPFGLEQTVTQGIISATGRVIGSGPYDDFLQTDAPINPGNSGGPLVNLKGEVIGINTAITASGQGIGFSIPSNMAKSVAEQLKKKGKVTRGWIGVAIQGVTPELAQSFGMPEPKGALVAQVTPGGPAAKAGIKAGDIIVVFDGKQVKDSNELPRLVAETPVGKTVDLQVVREKKEVRLSITVQELTAARAAPPAGPQAEGLGMKLEDLTPRLQKQLKTSEKSGVVVLGVEPGSLADAAGIQQGDIIRQVNRATVNNLADFNRVLGESGNSQQILLLLKRGGQSFFVTLQVQ